MRPAIYCLKVLKILFLEVGEQEKRMDFPAEELNILLCVLKERWRAYGPPTQRPAQSSQRSLQRYLKRTELQK